VAIEYNCAGTEPASEYVLTLRELSEPKTIDSGKMLEGSRLIGAWAYSDWAGAMAHCTRLIVERGTEA
jgi:hypothetical protein